MIIIVLLISILTFQAQGADIGYSVRALGMGNAYTAVVNDSDSLFYNPAGYAKMSGFRWLILDPGFGLNNIDSYEDYLDIAEDSSDMSQILNDLYGDEITIFAGAKSLFSVGGFSFGAYGVADGNFLVNNPVFPNIESSYRLDYGFVAAFGMDLVPDMFDIGLQTRRVARQGGSVPIGVSTIATLDSETIQNEFNKKGVGYAFDLGMNLTFPGSLKPTFSFTWRDMGNTTFEADIGEIAPKPVQQEQIIGMGFVWESILMDIRTALDYRFLNDASTQVGKKVNFGIEFSWPFVDVRGGFHQGYYTLGAGVDAWIMKVDVATYGVELGAYPGQLEDRRYMLQMSFEFGIDPGSVSFFKLNRPSVKNHSRKQRR